MELLQLKYFQKVAKLEHMTKAAEELRIAQPALSKTISLLEKNLGVLLFDRTGKYIKLNSNGKAFLKKVDIALMALEDGQRELNNLKGEVLGEVRLLVLVASHMIPEILTEFEKRCPNISFKLIQHLPDWNTTIDFDLCISSAPISMPNIESITLLSEEILLAVPESHPLAAKTSISLKEVENESFISLKPGTNLRELTDRFCHNAGFNPNVVFESDDPATVRGLIKAGLGLAFIPEISWGGAIVPSTALLHIEDPLCYRTLKLYWLRDKYLPKSAELFKDFLIDFFHKVEKISTS